MIKAEMDLTWLKKQLLSPFPFQRTSSLFSLLPRSPNLWATVSPPPNSTTSIPRSIILSTLSAPLLDCTDLLHLPSTLRVPSHHQQQLSKCLSLTLRLVDLAFLALQLAYRWICVSSRVVWSEEELVGGKWEGKQGGKEGVDPKSSLRIATSKPRPSFDSFLITCSRVFLWFKDSTQINSDLLQGKGHSLLSQ